MFTGIVQELGTVMGIRRGKGLVRLSVEAPRTASKVQSSESVAVNGVCLSVVSVQAPALTFEVIAETLSLTTLGKLRGGARVNLEPSLSITDRLGGQILFGHVDGMGTVAKRRQRSGETTLDIRVPGALRRFLVPKGPVAVDGISLTVGRVLAGSTFSVHLIPETLRRTTLSDIGEGGRVNLEVDYFAKLIAQLVNKRWNPSRTLC
jgi:riboflavin synthase